MSNFSKSEKEIFELRKQKISFFNELSSNSFPTSFEGTVDIENIITKHKDINDGEHTGIDVQLKEEFYKQDLLESSHFLIY